MNYHLLTGATGLLGNYLVRDLMDAGVPLAVLVRPSRRQTARQRVELQLADWERQLGRLLKRPVVLEGDISQADLGLDAVSMRWVAEYCDTLIHNAASLQFHATSEESEPYRSNLGGTQNVLDLCRTLGIRKLHHVSTAYVAGQRQGLCLETEVDVGQSASNDYEVSKLQAEKLVRAADFIDPPTVFRPGIIIGDSETGFTTTYHGFYAALQLCHTICKTMPQNETGRINAGRVRLALDGSETKHLVPVEWVSAVMAHVMTHPEHHGQTYHLTPQTPVTMRQIRDVLEQSVGFYGAVFAGRNEPMTNLQEAEELFYEHIKVYNSYWKEDPVFDQANVQKAAPHLPCPHVSRQLLAKMSDIVISADFPTPSKRPFEVDFDVQGYIQSLLDQGGQLRADEPVERLLGLEVLGSGGGTWQLLVRDGQLVGAEVGVHPSSIGMVQLSVESFSQLTCGGTSLPQLLVDGDLKFTGPTNRTRDYQNVLGQVATLASAPM